MRLLILGGTVFLGRHVVLAAQAAGHDITLLNRGRSQPELFPMLRRVTADRDGGLGPIQNERWDAIIDTSGFLPRVVAQSVALHWGRYVFVSSVSAYMDLSKPNEEGASTWGMAPDEDISKHYGALKADCERLLVGRPGGIVVRPGLIGGPFDPTGRFTYWPRRLAEGGRVLAPGPPCAPVQVIDARDLAAWLVKLAEEGPDGVYNAVGDETPMLAALETILAAVGGQAELCWRSGLTGLSPWSELPWWVGDEPDSKGMMQTPNAQAKAAGLKLRPLAETARDTLEWARSLSGDPPRQADGRYRDGTLKREREAELLAGTLV